MPSHLAIVLVTSTPSTLEQEGNCRKVVDWMKAFKIDHKVVDGADAVNHALRTELFGISNLKGKYPQVFLTNKSDSTVFVGDFEKVQMLVEDNNLPQEVLDKNGVKNFITTFASAKLS